MTREQFQCIFCMFFKIFVCACTSVEALEDTAFDLGKYDFDMKVNVKEIL